MTFDRRAIGALVRNDLRSLLRSPRTLVMSVLLPLLILPLMLLISQQVRQDQEERVSETTFVYALEPGPEEAFVRRLLDGLADDERLREATVSDAAASLERDEIHFWLAGGSADRAADEGGLDESVPAVEIYHRADRELSREGTEHLSDELVELRQDQRARLLRQRGFPVSPADAGIVESLDVATAASASGLQLGRFLPLMIVLLLMTGGSVVAGDSLAGEKERGTLETLLTTAIRRIDLVVAKQLGILLVAVAITAIQLGNLLLYLGLGLVDLPSGFSIPITPSLTVLLLFLFLPIAALLSSALLLTSAYAKSYKEAQLYYLPLFVLALVPTLAPLLPALELRSIIVLVPIANLSIAVKDVLSGDAEAPWIAAAWIVTAIASIGAARLSLKTLTRESLITTNDWQAADLVGGAALFPRHVLRWCAVLWALILVGSSFLGTSSLQQQLSFNFGVLLLGMALMMRRYSLPLRQTLALRWPHPLVWPAVVIGAPSALIVGANLFRFADIFLPVPERMLEEFERALFPQDMPMWQLLLLLAILPAIVEELFFRGLLLQALADKPVVRRVLLSSIIFGLFHVSFFRILPTAYLGTMLAATTLLSGSILPAMVWHGLNNALGVWPASATLVSEPRWLLLAIVGLALCAALLWRGRRRPASEARSG